MSETTTTGKMENVCPHGFWVGQGVAPCPFCHPECYQAGSAGNPAPQIVVNLYEAKAAEIAELKADLEREREAHYHAVGRSNGFEFRASEKFAMRKEFEALLGVEHGAAGDEQFQKGMDAIRALLSDRGRLRKVEHLAKLGYHLSMYAAEIQWDGCRNRAAWLDGLRDAIVELQQQYRDTFGED